MAVLNSEEYICDICGSKSFEVEIQGIRDNSGTVSGSYDICRCKKCGHHNLSPYPSREEIRSLYPNKYYAHDGMTRGHKGNLKWFLKRLSYRKRATRRNKINEHGEYKCSFLGKFLAEPSLVPNGTLLDVGSGWGEYVRFAESCGWDAHGLEPDENAVMVGRNYGLDIICGTAEEIPFENRYFDVVRSWHVLEHTYSPMKAITEMSRVLKPNGHLLISIPNYGSSQRKVLGMCWPHLEVPRHLHHFNVESFKNILNKNGLEPIQKLHSGVPFVNIRWRLVACQRQGVPSIKAWALVIKSVIWEIAERIKGAEAGAYITWWIRKHEN